MHWTSERTGIAFSMTHMLLWGLFPVFAKATFTDIAPLWSVGIGVLSATILFAGMVGVRREWTALPDALRSRGVWANTIFNGTLYYVLFYVGLRTTTAGNASIVALFEVLTTIIILGLVRHSERMNRRRLIGSFLIVVGVLIILLRNAAVPRGGELLILLATFIVPLGNLAGKDALGKHSAVLVLFVRSLISGVLLCILAWAFHGLPSTESVRAALPGMLFTGLLLLGLAKIFWMESMSRIQIALCVSIGSLSPVVTLLAGALFLQESIRMYHLFALLPVLLGIRLLLRQPRPLQSAEMEI